ncbi:MAG: hypothetical protein A3H70_01465 [Candidatus Komeilibacteria bacterium RIFCSPLOWO2_02_FULL_48_11]|uniref:ComEC/Rec2-related protein domain-containing protein n=1 Tax=Candidatus Komeilibacteria bacterium RIFCSPLOWO2_02_FULL_48_11 TaxID=1798553 RepID=A0A1G2BS45_9BACT|nr:MAG: hypothetical protein A3H70_01465 [Candidatus Komeilibacteria bacterium RIFCSPLOWO2_02_FULL_48_11]
MPRLARSKVFLICLLAFVLGVLAASFLAIKFVYLYGFLLLLLVGFFIFWFQRTWRIITLWGLFFVLGMIRLVLSEPVISNPSHISFYNGQKVVVEAVVTEEPDVRLDGQKLTVSVIANKTRHPDRPAVLGGEWRDPIGNPRDPSTPLRSARDDDKLKGRLLIKTALYPQYQYGDLLKITCAIEAPEQIEDFAYDKYLARYDIYSVCWRGQIEKIGSNQGNLIKAALLSIKARFIGAINSSLPEPHASLLAGILVGARRGIPDYLLEAFNRVGVTHIIAISGSNITIIAAALLILMQSIGVSRRRTFWLISLGIGAFVIMTGASASVVRAGIMGLFVLLASQLGRATRATNALVFTAFVMLLINPKILVFDAGFQLSFLATMGIVYISPILQNLAKRWPKLFGLKEVLIATLSAIIMTTPLILYQFGRFSVIAPLANLLIVPAVPTVMAVGFITGLVSLASSAVGSVIGWGAWTLLEYIIRVAEFLSSWSFASLELYSFHWVFMAALYGVIGWCVFKITVKDTRHKIQ